MKESCKRCLYDEGIPGVTIDAEGVCNLCRTHDELEREYPLGPAGEQRLQKVAQEIRKAGRGRKYDCVIGVSGGCDSSFLVHKMVQLGVRPLAVHFDNTWNSTIATENIKNVLSALGVDLFTLVVDNKEYDDIYRSFMKAGVPDLEAPTDLALAATIYRAAEKYGIRYSMEGHSFRTEGIAPLGWIYMDGRYIASVQKKFGSYPMKTYPNMPMHLFLKWMLLNRIKRLRPLYYMDYRKETAKQELQEKYGWKWYGGHHLENRFTAFYHSYYMPRRFGVDERVLGYSALIRSGQMTQAAARELLKQPPYLEPEIVELVKKRMGFSDQEFEALMTAPRHSYREFKTYKHTFELMRPFFWLMYRMELVPKSFYMKYCAPDRRDFKSLEIAELSAAKL